MIVPSDQPPRVVDLVLTVDPCAKTLACLEGRERLGELPFHVLVWDKGSFDGTGEQLKSRHLDVIVHHCARNLGVASGRNAAARLALDTLDPEFLLFLDNDMLVSRRDAGLARGLFDFLGREG